MVPASYERACGQHQKCTATTRYHAQSGWMYVIGIDTNPIPTMIVSSLEQCTKTCEVQHTPIPVRGTGAPKVLHGPTCRRTTREGTAGPSTGAGPLV